MHMHYAHDDGERKVLIGDRVFWHDGDRIVLAIDRTTNWAYLGTRLFAPWPDWRVKTWALIWVEDRHGWVMFWDSLGRR